MNWTAALGRAIDRFTPWARDIERAEVLRDAGPGIPWAELDRIQGRRPRRPDLLAQAEQAAGQRAAELQAEREAGG